jgi:hypothetical protein
MNDATAPYVFGAIDGSKRTDAWLGSALFVITIVPATIRPGLCLQLAPFCFLGQTFSCEMIRHGRGNRGPIKTIAIFKNPFRCSSQLTDAPPKHRPLTRFSGNRALPFASSPACVSQCSRWLCGEKSYQLTPDNRPKICESIPTT